MPDQRALEPHSENCVTKNRRMMDVQYYARQKSLLEEKVGSKSLKNAKKSYEQYDPTKKSSADKNERWDGWWDTSFNFPNQIY